MKSRIVFVASPTRGGLTIGYPLGLTYISAVLRKNDYDVSIHDYTTYSHGFDRFIKEIKAKSPDFIGFMVYTRSYNEVKKMISMLRFQIPRAKIMIGGPHVSALPVHSLVDLNADFAVVGEGEYLTLDIINKLGSNCNNFDDAKGLAFWKDNKPVLNPGCNLIHDLDELPFPSWDLLSFNDYEDIVGHAFFKAKPIAPLMTSRGCPHQCSFCASHVIHGKKFRRRSARNVVDEVEFLIKNYGIKEINIIDDTFSEAQEHALGICEEIIKRKLRISWKAPIGLRADTINDDLLKVFKASGCYSVSIGIESFNDKVLLEMKKPLSKSHLADKICMVRKYGIETVGFFILGLPEDTEDSIRETINFANKSMIDFPTFTQAVPLPGSDVFKQKYANVDLNKIDWDNFNYTTRFPPTVCEVPSNKLKKLYSIAYLSCYLSPKRIFKVLTYILYKRKMRIIKALKTGYNILMHL